MTIIHADLNDHPQDLVSKTIGWTTSRLAVEIPRLDTVTRLDVWHHCQCLQGTQTFFSVATCKGFSCLGEKPPVDGALALGEDKVERHIAEKRIPAWIIAFLHCSCGRLRPPVVRRVAKRVVIDIGQMVWLG